MPDKITSFLSPSGRLYYEDDKCKALHSFILHKLLYAEGFIPYGEEFESVTIQLRDMSDTDAKVDSKDRVITFQRKIGENYLKNQDDPKLRQALSFLVRHELLHIMLEHIFRALARSAMNNKFNPDDLTDEQFMKLVQNINKPSFIGRQFGSSSNTNIGADLEDSMWYLEDSDVKYARKTGGLIIQEHPEWAKYSFEQIMDALEALEKLTLAKSMPRVHARLDPDGNLVPDTEEEPSWFQSQEVVALDDVRSARLMSSDEATIICSKQQIISSPIFQQLKNKTTWVQPTESDNCAQEAKFYTDGCYIKDKRATKLSNLVPVIMGKNLDLYKPGVKLFGKPLLPINAGFALFCDVAVENTQYNSSDKDLEYDGSAADFALEEWFNDSMRNERISRQNGDAN